MTFSTLRKGRGGSCEGNLLIGENESRTMAPSKQINLKMLQSRRHHPRGSGQNTRPEHCYRRFRQDLYLVVKLRNPVHSAFEMEIAQLLQLFLDNSETQATVI